MTSAIKWVLDLDVKKFASSLQGAGKELESLGEKGNVSNLISSFEMLGKAAAGFAAVKLVQSLGEAALEASLLAEEVRVVNNQFEMLATDAGLNAQKLADDLAKVSDGLVDDEDLLKASSQAIVAMGANAEKLPQVFELAKKAASSFGGDALERFEQINQAIQSGQTRQLKQIGINVDAEKAYKDYARSIGVTVDQLSEEGKQYALMQQVLKTGSDKFKNVQADARELANNVTRLKVAFGDLKETVAIVFDKVLGPAVKGSVDAVAYAAKWWNQFFKKNLGTEGTENANKAKEALKELGDEATKTGEKVTKASHTKAVDPEQRLQAEKAYMAEVNRLRQDEVQARIAAATTYDQWEEGKRLEREAKEQEYQAQRNIKEQELRANALLTKQEKDNLLEQLELAHKLRMDAMDTQFENEKKRKVEEFDKRAYEAQNSFAGGWKQAGNQASKDLEDWSKRGSRAANVLTNRLGAAFTAMGEGSQTAGEAMKGFMFASLADIADAEGQMLMLSGIATMNPGKIAGGAALKALAGVLKSQARGSSTSFGGADSGGPGTPGFGGQIVSPSDRPEAEQSPRKSVTLQVMGNIYETEDTKTRLVQLIRDATDATDFKYQQIGVS